MRRVAADRQRAVLSSRAHTLQVKFAACAAPAADVGSSSGLQDAERHIHIWKHSEEGDYWTELRDLEFPIHSLHF